MATVGELNSDWSLGTSTGSLCSTSSTPRLCTHRGMYRGAGSGTGGTDVARTPELQPSPAGDSRIESSPSGGTTSRSPKDRDRHNPVDVAHIRLRPEIGVDQAQSAAPSGSRDPLPGYPSAQQQHPSNHRSVNEELDMYMVIRQRSFHGYARSKHDLRQLPQTDPREIDSGLNPDWLHRSKTDLYIERRRAKLASQRARRRGGSGGYNLDGITLGSLMNQLPVPGKRDHNGNRKVDAAGMRCATTPSGSPASLGAPGSETRFPPLTINRMKEMIRHDIRSYGLESRTKPRRPSTTANILPAAASTTFPVPDPPPNSPPPSSAREDTASKRGRLRKQPLGSIPLRIWEPSLDYVLKSNPKQLQPRQAVRSLAHQTAGIRHQPSPLK